MKPSAYKPFASTRGPATAFSPLQRPTISYPALTKAAVNTITRARVQQPSEAAPTFSLSIPSISIATAEADDDDKDQSGTVRGLTIAVSIVSVLLALAIVTCIYLAQKMRHQARYYEEQLAARTGGVGAQGYQPQYVEGNDADEVPLVAYEEKDVEAGSRRSSVSSHSSHRN